jgi:ferredoxin-type protein NapH
VRVSKLRYLIQVGFFVLLIYAGMLGLRRLTVWGHELSLPTLSCEYAQLRVMKCYLHDLQTFATRGAADRYMSLIEPTVFFLLLCLLAGRAWCGWACPLGLIQDIASDARAKLGFGSWRAGRRTKEAFAFTAYALLGFMVVIAVLIGRPDSRLYPLAGSLASPYCLICPGRQVLPLLQGDAANFLLFDRFTAVTRVMSALAMLTVGLFVLGMPVMRRFWCRICVLGILMQFLRVNRWSLFALTKEPKRCTYCGACERACPVDISEVFEERERTTMRQTDCQLCLKCVEACPEDDALKAKWAGRVVMSLGMCAGNWAEDKGVVHGHGDGSVHGHGMRYGNQSRSAGLKGDEVWFGQYEWVQRWFSWRRFSRSARS